MFKAPLLVALLSLTTLLTACTGQMVAEGNGGGGYASAPPPPSAEPPAPVPPDDFGQANTTEVVQPQSAEVDTVQPSQAKDASGAYQADVDAANAADRGYSFINSDTVFFATNSSSVSEAGKAILAKQIAWLQKNPTRRVTIEGNCDERGTREYNIALGLRRANAVKVYLARAGIEPSRINMISYGKERPLVPGSDDAAYARNRRSVTIPMPQ